jgi:hypothetical protein
MAMQSIKNIRVLIDLKQFPTINKKDTVKITALNLNTEQVKTTATKRMKRFKFFDISLFFSINNIKAYIPSMATGKSVDGELKE